MRAAFRLRALTVLTLVALLCVPAVSSGSGAAAPAPVRSAAPVQHAAAIALHPAPVAPPAVRPPLLALRNMTVDAPAAPRPAASNPTSVVTAVPPPTTPSTKPVVFTWGTFNQSTIYRNFTAPLGNWSLIELNYTGVAVATSGAVYDSSYRAYVNSVQVFFGTSPEYGQWTATRDLTPYASLFQGTVNFTFLFSGAFQGCTPWVNCYFSSTPSILFYPEPTGVPAPSRANLVVPLWQWNHTSVTAAFPSLTVNHTIPSDVTNATLELWAYGFSGSATLDEFWYSSVPAFREMVVSVDGRMIETVLPFPYVNTGGIDLFLWRPITGAFTTSNRPYEFDVSGALGLIEGAHNFSVSVNGRASDSRWLVAGNLFLYTNPAVTGSYSTSYSEFHHFINNTGGNPHTQMFNDSYAYSSIINTTGGTTNASSKTSETFESTDSIVSSASGPTTSQWQNVTQSELIVQTAQATQGSSQRSSTRVYDFPFSMDYGVSFTQTSSTNGTYPVAGNYTDVLDSHQEWNESESLLASVGPSTFSSIDNTVVGSNGITEGRESFASSNSAPVVLSYHLITASSTNEYAQSLSVGPLESDYRH
ncbi:MAG: hypothetical protein L3K09_07625, partial [Thermoplasmata archaeon]|nr:hypothetical protein [Thermoplasmata archaeon]